MAAQILNVGTNRVYFDPSRISEIKEAITKQDIIDLIKDKAIKKKPKIGQKRRAAKKKLKRKQKGRRRGHGNLKKTMHKENYPKRIRKLRSYLKFLKKKNNLSKEKYRRAYILLNSGELKNKQEIYEKIK